MRAVPLLIFVALSAPGCGPRPGADAGLPDADASPGGTLAPIVIDGRFEDWREVPAALDDGDDDGLGRIWLAHDERSLFLRFEVGRVIDLNEPNGLRIYLDTDADRTTGLQVAGVGAELEWRPGDRAGRFRHEGQSVEILHGDIRFFAEPTVTSDEFEVAFARDARPDGVHPLFSGDEIRVMIRDDETGDRAPELGSDLSYVFRPDGEIQEAAIALERQSPGDLRLATYNVLFDSPWTEDGEDERFGRQLAAVRPDIVCFQEIWNHPPHVVGNLVARWTGMDPVFATGHNDCVVVSRFPIVRAFRLSGNAAVLLNTTEVLGRELLVINVHLPCCEEEQGRQDEADAITAFLRDARHPGGELELAEGTPIVITGDTNLVGLAAPLETLLAGDIADEARFGADCAPDWDGSELTDLISRHTERRLGYTWRSEWGDFWPGRLDYIIYSDSVLRAPHHFVLDTSEMSSEALAAHGLRPEDSRASDHLLFCADFRLRP